jgi:hypothetical protein
VDIKKASIAELEAFHASNMEAAYEAESLSLKSVSEEMHFLMEVEAELENRGVAGFEFN